MIYALAAGLALLVLALISARPRRNRTGLYVALKRLHARPEQERVIREAVWDMRVAGGKFVRDTRDARTDLAELLRDEDFDDEGMHAWFSEREEQLEKLKPRLAHGMKQIHRTLDSAQREKLSRLLEAGPPNLFGHRHAPGH